MSALSRVRPGAGGRATNGGAVASPAAPPAQRLSASRWRQPRLVVGLLLVAAAVVLGARVVDGLDDSVLVWQVDSAARAGSPAAALDLHPVAVRFDDDETQAAYLAADQPVPSDGIVVRDLEPGQLLAEADLEVEPQEPAGQLPIDVSSGSMPADLAVGERVDVWVVPGADTTGGDPAVGPTGSPVLTEAVQVLAQVRVAGITAPEATVGATRQLLVDLSVPDADRLDVVLGQLAKGRPVAVRVPAAVP